MPSAMLPNSDMARRIRYFVFVPKESCTAAKADHAMTGHRTRRNHRSSPRYLVLDLRTAKASSRLIWRRYCDASAVRDCRRLACIPRRAGGRRFWQNGCRGFFVSASGNERGSQKENVSGRGGGDGCLRSFWMVLRSSGLRKILESRFDPFGPYRNRGNYNWIPDFVDKTLGLLSPRRRRQSYSKGQKLTLRSSFDMKKVAN